jgi:hypothetical protein
VLSLPGLISSDPGADQKEDEDKIAKRNLRTSCYVSDSEKALVVYMPWFSHLLTSTLVSLMLGKVVDSLVVNRSLINKDLPNALLLRMRELCYDQFRETIESIKRCRSTG